MLTMLFAESTGGALCLCVEFLCSVFADSVASTVLQLIQQFDSRLKPSSHITMSPTPSHRPSPVRTLNEQLYPPFISSLFWETDRCVCLTCIQNQAYSCWFFRVPDAWFIVLRILSNGDFFHLQRTSPRKSWRPFVTL